MLFEIQKIGVKVEGLSDIMFDRFIDHSKDVRPPEQRLYLAKENKLVFPAANIDSFLFGENPGGCAKTFEGKKSKGYIRVGQGHIVIDPQLIPFCRKGKEITYSGFGKSSPLWVHDYGAPRTKQGSLSIKQEVKKRPVLGLPWELSFQIALIKNDLIDETKLYNWFSQGGILLAFGTYRPKFGRFVVADWEIKTEKRKRKSK